jgi:hypothetical protein
MSKHFSTSYNPWWKRKDYDDYYDDEDDGRWGRSIFRKSYKSFVGNSGELSRTINRSSWYGESYYSYSSVGKEEDAQLSKLIEKAYSSVKDMITIMDFPFLIRVNLNEGSDESSSYSDYFSEEKRDNSERRIAVPSKIFDSTEDNETKINAFCGFGLHEAAHLRYTYLRVYLNFLSFISGKYTFEEGEIIKIFINLLEDNRVEDLLLTERPGFQDFIDCAKSYNSKTLEEKLNIMRERKLILFFKTLIGILRFPGLIEEEVLEEYSEVYKEVQEKITPYPENLKDICSVSESIFKIIKKKKLSDIDPAELKKILFLINGTESITSIMYGVDLDSGRKIDKSKVSRLLSSKDSLTMKILEGTVERGDSDKVFFEKPKGDRNDYLRDVRAVQKYVPRLKKILTGTDKNYDFNIQGCRSGILDTTKLAEAYQGVPQVYLRQGHVRTNKSTICVLIDESGSMGGKKEILARQAAILLNETFGKSLGVNLYIYGHTADIGSIGYINLSVYREGSHYNPKFSLSKSCAKSQNRDGDAILEVAKRVRKFTKENCIMFVISDGSPCANGYGGIPAIKDTAAKVKEAEKLGFGIIQISIDAVYGVKDMFDTYIDIGYNLEEMPKLLNEIVKTKVIKTKHTTVS